MSSRRPRRRPLGTALRVRTPRCSAEVRDPHVRAAAGDTFPRRHRVPPRPASLTRLTQHLHAETDAEQRRSTRCDITNRSVQAWARTTPCPRQTRLPREEPDALRRVRLRDRRSRNRCAKPAERTRDRREVRDARVDDYDVTHVASLNVPLVEGTSVGMGVRDSLSQRQSDGLNAASRGGDVFSLQHLNVAGEPPRSRKRAQDVRHILNASPPIDSRWRPSDTSANARRQIHDGARERFIEAERRPAEARDPRRLAQRPIERLAQRERGIFGRVMIVDVAGRRSSGV